MASTCKLPKSHRKEICECILLLNADDQVDAPLQTLEAADGKGEGERADSESDSVSVAHCKCITSAESHSPYPYTCFDGVIAVVSIIFYLTDIGTDSWLAWTYYTQRRWTYFGLTLAFLCVPSIVMNISSFCWFFADYKAYKKKQNWGHSWLFWFFVHITCCIFQLGPVLRYGTVIYYGFLSQRKMSDKERRLFYHLMLEEDKDSCMLRLFECSMEAGPQLILQLYILVHQEEADVPADTFQFLIQVASVLTSWFGISWSHVAYHRALRLSREDKKGMTIVGTIFYFCWRLFEVLSRVLALCMFAIQYKYWVFVATSVHWMVMTGWFFCQRVGEAKMFHNACLDFGFNMMCGAVSVFCFFNVKDGHSRFRCLIYYIIVYLENAAFVFLWFFLTKDLGAWFHFPALFAVLLGFFVGIAFQMVYYVLFHPGGNIKMCLPREEFEHSVCFKQQHHRHSHDDLQMEEVNKSCCKPEKYLIPDRVEKPIRNNVKPPDHMNQPRGQELKARNQKPKPRHQAKENKPRHQEPIMHQQQNPKHQEHRHRNQKAAMV